MTPQHYFRQQKSFLNLEKGKKRMTSPAINIEDVRARPELLQVADTVARDKGIEREEVLEAMEQAIQKAGRSKYGYEHDIRAYIDRKSGEIQLARYVEIVDDNIEIENEAAQIKL